MSIATQKIEKTLDNGLKVVLIKDPTAQLVAARTYVRAGSVNEEDYLGTGISHYLEHLLAGGTTAMRSENDYKALIAQLGGAFNAYTTTDHTAYYLNTVPKYLNDAISILHEWMFHATFTDREVSREQQVIIKEIEKNNANIPRQFYQLTQNNFYKFHPIRLPVIGYLENFKTITKEHLIDYYSSKYTPSNIVLVVGGNFDEEQVMTHIQNTFGKEEAKAPPEQISYPEPPPFSPRTVEKTGLTNVTYLSIRFPTVDLFSEDLYPLDLLDFILGNGQDSILYKTLVEEQKIAYSVSVSSYTPSVTNGYFDITAEIDYANKDKVQDEINKIITQVKHGKLTTKQIKKAKKQKIAEDIFSISNIEDKVSRVGQSAMYAFSTDMFEVYVQNFKAIDEKDVIRVAKTFLEPERAIVTILKPGSDEQESEVTSNADALTQPTPTMRTLDNGVRLIFLKDSSMPKVFIKGFLEGGIRAETKDNNGVGHLTSQLLGKASNKYTKAQIFELIEGNGANLYGSLGNNTLYFSLECLDEDQEDLLPVWADTFLNPIFKSEELEEQKRKTLNWITQRKDDWHTFGSYTFKQKFYENHPYGLSRLGEKDSIEALTQKEIQTYYQQLLDPEQLVITITGNFDETQILTFFKQHFEHLTPPENAYNSKQSITRNLHQEPLQEIVDIPQDVAGVFIGFDAEKVTNTNESAQLDILDAVLSGMNYPGGRFHNILREKGLVYMVHAVNHPGIEQGHLLIYALTSKEKAAEVIQIITDQINDVKNNPIPSQEFEQALAQLTYYHKDRLSTLESLSIIMATDELYGKGFDHYLGVDQSLESLSAQDVQEAATRYLNNAQVFIFQNNDEKNQAEETVSE